MCEAPIDNHSRLTETPQQRALLKPGQGVENDGLADVDGESLRCWYATATSDPRRQLTCTPAFPPRPCFVSVVVVGGLAVSHQDRYCRLTYPDSGKITTSRPGRNSPTFKCAKL